MKLLSRRDTYSALATGLITGLIAWRILVFLDKGLPFGFSPALLVGVIPVLWLAGVQFGYLLSVVFSPMEQFGKFVAIGFANAAVDFGVLYLFIGLTGHTGGGYYALFKAVSFSCGVVHSYFWNKYWAFDAGQRAITGGEVLSFLGVALASLVINVGSASAVIAVHAPDGITPASWDGIGAMVGSAVALIFNFIGLRAFVFGKK